MEKQLQQLMAQLFRIDEKMVTDGLTMSDLDVWDSLKHMELVVAIEQTFNVELSFDEIVAMQNVGAIKQILMSKTLAMSRNGTAR